MIMNHIAYPSNPKIATVGGVDYPLVRDVNGCIRFVKRPIPEAFKNYPMFKDKDKTYDFPDLNLIWYDFTENRVLLEDIIDLYTSMAYSVYGMWEIFVWHAKNKRIKSVVLYIDGLEYPKEWYNYRTLSSVCVEVEQEIQHAG